MRYDDSLLKHIMQYLIMITWARFLLQVKVNIVIDQAEGIFNLQIFSCDSIFIAESSEFVPELRL